VKEGYGDINYALWPTSMLSQKSEKNHYGYWNLLWWQQTDINQLTIMVSAHTRLLSENDRVQEVHVTSWNCA